MVKVHDLSKSSLRRARAASRVAAAAIVAAVVVVVGTASFTSRDEFPAAALGRANATTPTPTLIGSAPASVDDSASNAASREFDYFPGNYRNQATEPAEPIATF